MNNASDPGFCVLFRRIEPIYAFRSDRIVSYVSRGSSMLSRETDMRRAMLDVFRRARVRRDPRMRVRIEKVLTRAGRQVWRAPSCDW